jgi:hypothetical protein
MPGILGMDRRGSSEGLALGGICLLFLFCSLVPSHYVYFLGEGWLGALGSLLPMVPAALSLAIGLLAVRRLWEGGRSIAGVAAAVGLVVATGVIGGAGSEVPLTSVTREIYYLLTGAVLGLAIAAGAASGERTPDFLWSVTLVAALVAAYGVFEFVSGTNPIWGRFYTADSPRYAGFAKAAVLFGDRIKGSVGHPGSFGVYLSLCLPVTVAVALESKGGKRLVGWICVGVIATGLLLTFTRGAWLGGFVAMLVYFSRYALRHLAIAVVVAVVFAAGMLSVDKVWDTLKNRGTVAQLQNFERDPRGVAYRQVGDIVQAQPFFGIGTANYRFLAERFGDYDDSPDSMYLRVLAENGIVGTTAFVGLLVALLSTLHRIEGRLRTAGRTRDATYVWAVFASVCGFAAALVLNDVLYFTLTRVTFWLLVGAGLALGVEEVKEVGEGQ